jgi:hypothetical protein
MNINHGIKSVLLLLNDSLTLLGAEINGKQSTIKDTHIIQFGKF